MDTDKIIKQNKSIDASQLAKAIKAVQELRNAGGTTKGYDLVRPFSITGARRQASNRKARKSHS